jgi:hypothetical protein
MVWANAANAFQKALESQMNSRRPAGLRRCLLRTILVSFTMSITFASKEYSNRVTLISRVNLISRISRISRVSLIIKLVSLIHFRKSC